MQSHSLTMDGDQCFRFRGGWPELRGRDIVSCVMAAIALEDAAREEMKLTSVPLKKGRESK
jgi:hypothetical protein